MNLILAESLKRGASDIHIEPYEKDFRVRFRIDGILYNMLTPPLRLKESITSRIKIMGKMDISEKRLPQDGRIKIRTTLNNKKKEIDYRVSSLPTLFGEKIVMRILDRDNLPLDMTKLGFEEASLKRVEEAILKPYGMVLVTGPTGSGKTSTLYAALNRLNTTETNIITAEIRFRSKNRSASLSRRLSARSSGRIPTSSSWVRSVILRLPRSRSRLL